ncbi:putative secreted protein (Por secretion system target) [Lacibacter cauensis]|uniref:Putative secreted protein (Por secretion system target) n=1 Tax=Lacibacter cauensis TaxID=510947 RepID=A0A562SCN9_9BACT|nr:T9SS type A sorting domain-containing protein [Lacibacter cauensis]TWI79115.1 putative secreted protein (Por secretion system target) [Lacibacter cauensis]
MKKFLLSCFLLTSLSSVFSQALQIEEFTSGTLPAGWDLASGMKVDGYNNPGSTPVACAADFGLLTPGVGGNNPSRVLTPAYTYNSTIGSLINVGFTIYVFNSDDVKKCITKSLPCTTYVKVYLVDESVTTATIPSNPALIFSESDVTLVQGNTANKLVVASGSLTNNRRYRILYDFSVPDLNCNQNGTKYILDRFLIAGTNAPLPVTLKSFDAVQKSGKVTLTWNTMLELNNDGFEIERRIGTGAYQKIAFVDSKAPGGNGDAYSYSFDDNTALPKGVTYYRLKQVDFDGRATYSEIRAVRSANGTLLLSVYPNPSRGTTNVAIPAGTGMVDVTLSDFTGKSLQQWTGLNTSNLQLTNLKPGMYTLRVSVRATGETITERIAVQ